MNHTDNIAIYRCVKRKPETGTKLHSCFETMRPPGNVPYVVDNLWEWKRPEGYPCRRTSVFASPDPESARKSASNKGSVYRVEFKGNYTLCQLKTHGDSKMHEDCQDLKKLLLNRLGQGWVDGDLTKKGQAGMLWTPCLRKADVERLFDTVETLRSLKKEIHEAITYWNHVVLVEKGNPLPNNTGEVFFETEDGYYLRALND